jgi:peptide/nickel transport system ATP-binding protein
MEAIRLHENVSRAAARDRAARLLESVHIPDPTQRLSAYPHQLSGGMRQRVMIAMALSCYPRLLIADEPTTALDVTVQAQIVELLNELRETEGLAVLFVTHDLALISELSDEIAVMYAGQVVEHAATADLFARPRHPYTAALLAATPGIREPGGPPGAHRGPGSASRPVPVGVPVPPALRLCRGGCRSRSRRADGGRSGSPEPVPTTGRAHAARRPGSDRANSARCRCGRCTVTTEVETDSALAAGGGGRGQAGRRVL